MSFKELINKYQALLIENANLKEEIKTLKEKLNGTEAAVISKEKILDIHEAVICKDNDAAVNNQSEPEEKIKLFMSLFRGRDDVYAKRWESNKTGKSGYSPVCVDLRTVLSQRFQFKLSIREN